MSNYKNVYVNISDGQKNKLNKSLESGAETVSIRLSHADIMNGNDILAVTQSQLKKLAKAAQEGKGVTIKMSKT